MVVGLHLSVGIAAAHRARPARAATRSCRNPNFFVVFRQQSARVAGPAVPGVANSPWNLPKFRDAWDFSAQLDVSAAALRQRCGYLRNNQRVQDSQPGSQSRHRRWVVVDFDACVASANGTGHVIKFDPRADTVVTGMQTTTLTFRGRAEGYLETNRLARARVLRNFQARTFGWSCRRICPYALKCRIQALR